MRDILLIALGAVGGVAILRWILKNATARWIDYEFTKRLEAHKAQLNTANDAALERLRSEHAQVQAIQAAASSSFTAGHSAAHERRLYAIDILWREVLRLRSKKPAILGIADLITADETRGILADGRPTQLLDGLSLRDIVSWLFPNDPADAATVRPFAGEYLWSLFFAYRTVIGRIAIVFQEGYQQRHMKYWAEDPDLRLLLSTALTHDELDRFDKAAVNRVSLVLDAIEQKMLAEANRIISGQMSAEEGLKQARMIADAAARIEAENRRVDPSSYPRAR